MPYTQGRLVEDASGGYFRAKAAIASRCARSDLHTEEWTNEGRTFTVHIPTAYTPTLLEVGLVDGDMAHLMAVPLSSDRDEVIALLDQLKKGYTLVRRTFERHVVEWRDWDWGSKLGGHTITIGWNFRRHRPRLIVDLYEKSAAQVAGAS